MADEKTFNPSAESSDNELKQDQEVSVASTVPDSSKDGVVCEDGVGVKEAKTISLVSTSEYLVEESFPDQLTELIDAKKDFEPEVNEDQSSKVLDKVISLVNKPEEQVLEAAEGIKKKTTKKKKKSDAGVGEKKKKKKKSTDSKEFPVSPMKKNTSENTMANMTADNDGNFKNKVQHGLTNGLIEPIGSSKLPAAPASSDATSLPSVKELRKNYCEVAARSYTPNQVRLNSPKEFVLSQSVKDLRQSWFDISRGAPPPSSPSIRQEVRTSISVASMRPSFNMSREVDYNKKIHVRSVDASKVQKQFNQASENQAPKSCKLCDRQVFQMEQVKAEKAVWHKNCFRCKECGKQLNVDTYESHEGILYCKPHYKQLFQPKAYFDDDEPKFLKKKHELIIRESQPIELPPDVVRASDKASLGLDELTNLDVKARFNVFERKTESQERELAKSPSQIQVKKTEAILNKVARFQRNGSLHNSESESEHENEDQSVLRSSKKRERPQSFAAMGDVKQKFSEGCFAIESAQRREEFEKEKKEELIKLRARLCAGRQARLKEMYEDSVKDSETNIKRTVDTDLGVSAQNARSLKEQFEKGNCESDIKHRTFGEEDLSMLEVATAKQSRSLFKELDANAGKTEVTLRRSQSQMIPGEHRRSLFLQSQISNEVVRSSDVVEDVTVETHDIASRFKFFETFKQRQQEEKKEHKRFKITPPRELQPIQEPQDQEVYRDPTVIRADDKVEDELPKDTARKALSIFKQMEIQAAQQELASGPKPLKRFTPPPEYAGGDSESSEEESEYESEESEEESDSDEVDEGVIKSSDKMEDEFLRVTNERAIAKNLRNKFERWEAEVEKENRLNHSQSHLSLYEEEGIEHSLESTRDIKARFEALNNQPTTPVIEQKSRTKVHRFV